MSIVDKEQLKPYLDMDAPLIPLNQWNKQTKYKGKAQERGKTPLYSDWTTRAINKKDVLKRIKQGFNVGYRLREEDLIIDVDPRNFKTQGNSLEKLCEFLGVDNLADIYPTVITGSGGFHYYTLKPAEIHLREITEQFPGIEFKTKGRQVVAAGSKHPNGKMYLWDDFSPSLNERKQAPQKLLKLLERKIPEQKIKPGDVTCDQVGRLLEQLPVEDFDANDQWFNIMCACHHATNGAGIEEFLQWSLSDPDFVDDEQIIRARWDSLGEKELNITINTLYKEVLKYGGDTSVTTAVEDFEEIYKPDEFDEALEDVQESGNYPDIVSDDDNCEIARNLANNINPSSDNEELTKAIRAALYCKDGIEKIRILEMIQNNSKIKSGTFNKIKKTIEDNVNNRIAEDLCRMLAELTNRVAFNKGKGLIYSVGEQFWRYNGKFWSVITKRFLELQVTNTLDKLREKTEISKSENTLVTESSAILARIAAVDNDRLCLRERPKPIINCQNGELWINRDGSVKLRKHRPESYLLQVLNVEYNPSAECPLFEEALKRTFSKFKDRDDLIEFVFEMIGYIIQPNKDLEKWFLFNGSGGDGKSTLIRIISALLGEAVLPESVSMFATDKHVMSDVPGKLLIVDDDMNSKTRLPDGVLKKLCGRNDLNANPKGAKTERFTPATTLILSCNGLPTTDDLSEGGRRRPIVLPFNMSFHIDGNGGVVDIAEQIIEKELAGVLNKAIEGLARLRERGNFKEPISCVIAKENWIAESNMNALFVRDCIEQTKDRADTVSLKDLFNTYVDWSHENGIKHSSGKQFFRRSIEALGMEYTSIGHNKKGFRNVKLVNGYSDFEDFDEFEDF